MIKGALSQGCSHFRVKNILTIIIILNTFSCTQYAPKTLRERNRMIFSEGEQTIVSFSGDFSKKQRRNLKTLA